MDEKEGSGNKAGSEKNTRTSQIEDPLTPGLFSQVLHAHIYSLSVIMQMLNNKPKPHCLCTGLYLPRRHGSFMRPYVVSSPDRDRKWPASSSRTSPRFPVPWPGPMLLRP